MPSTVLRIQSAEGTKRVEVHPELNVAELYEIVKLPFKLEIGQFALYRERNFVTEIPITNQSLTIKSLQLQNGDLLYLKPTQNNAQPSTSTGPATTSAAAATTTFGSASSVDATKSSAAKSSKSIVEDDVDQQLSKLDGTIARKRDPKLCRHSSNGCCVHCSPIEPWDEGYLKEHKIKHMSFHSYLRKLTTGAASGRFVALETLSCRIKSGCTEHLPWPKGVCSKCQPSAITLNPQLYRHVDNVVFENASLVERFLDYWRTTGHQRVGFLYGRYEPHTDVPLGLRANVAAIYEPPQESSRDAVKLLDDEAGAEVDAMAEQLGLRKVGWIFTDLLGDSSSPGLVQHVRGIDTYFLSAEECILAAHLQNQHPNVSKWASDGTFGSKFVTVCVTGDAAKQVHMEGYAVSAQCMALVRDDCLVPTKDAPELGYIRESTDKQYVPDVYYKQKDQYGNEVSRLARPLPVEYLLVDVPASTPLVPVYTFPVREGRSPFPIENRYLDGHVHDFNALSTYLSQWPADEFLYAVSDFHFLLYLSRMDMLPIKPIIGDLLQAVRRQDAAAVQQWKTHEVWSTLETLITASSSNTTGRRDASSAAGNASETWTCNHCTFINGMVLDVCEMCGLPR